MTTAVSEVHNKNVVGLSYGAFFKVLAILLFTVLVAFFTYSYLQFSLDFLILKLFMHRLAYLIPYPYG